jgi:ABC-2 type transport system permease protein
VKVFDIALKDLLRSFRSTFALTMMFVAPLLIAGMIYFAFGSLMGSDGGFSLPLTTVQIVNLDQPDPDSGFVIGSMLVESLQSEKVADFLQVTEAPDEASARAAVDNQEAAVAVIIPADFTAAAMALEGNAAITLYPDPTLMLGPGVVKVALGQIVDSFAGIRIAVDVVDDQLGRRGAILDEETRSQVRQGYATWVQSLGQVRSEGAYPALDIQPPPGRAEPVSQTVALIGPIMAGMLIFFAFFTGANTAQSIVREDEEGTLARLFTTPIPQALILGGKFAAVFATVAVQSIVLLFVSGILFRIHWGEPLTVVLVTLGLVVAAAGFGVLLMSFVKSTRQAGPVIGGVLTLMGMAGGLFTTGMPSIPAAFDTITLFTPHGWALRSWKLTLAGTGDVLLPVVVMFGMGTVFFAVGALLFRRRFA